MIIMAIAAVGATAMHAHTRVCPRCDVQRDLIHCPRYCVRCPRAVCLLARVAKGQAGVLRSRLAVCQAEKSSQRYMAGRFACGGQRHTATTLWAWVNRRMLMWRMHCLLS